MLHTILLIGGNSGIGAGTARLLGLQGDSVIAAARTHETLAEAGVPVQPFDAAQPTPLDLPPALDGLVYFPGTITLKPFHRLTSENPSQCDRTLPHRHATRRDLARHRGKTRVCRETAPAPTSRRSRGCRETSGLPALGLLEVHDLPSHPPGRRVVLHPHVLT